MLYRNYQLNKTHSALKFGKSEGYPLVLSNAKSAPVRKLEVSGNSYQATRGKNLFNVDAITSTYGGYVENGTIYVTGYPYETGITPEKFLEMTELKEGDTFTTDLTYTQFGDTTNKTWGNMRFASKVSGVSNLDLVSKGTGITSTIPKNFNSSNYTSIYIYSGNAPEEGDIRSTCENMAVYKGAYTADTMPPYEPYVKMPSPDHPSEIRGVGDKTANLFDRTKTWGEYESIGEIKMYKTIRIQLKPNTTYYAKVFTPYNVASNKYCFLSRNSQVNAGISNCVSLVTNNAGREYENTIITDDTGYVYIGTTYKWSASMLNSMLSQCGLFIIEGTYTADTMPEYEPYGYRVPIECRGRNLFDMNKVITDGVVSNNGITAKNIDFFLTAGTYTLQLTANASCSVWLRKGQVDKGYFSQLNLVTDVSYITSFTFDSDMYLRISTFATDVMFYDIQILEGTYTAETMPSYEPYYHDTVNIYTDKPLYGIDDYTDSITLDFEKKKAVRTDKTREIILSTMGVYRKCENVIRFAVVLSSYKGARMMCDGLQCLAEGKQAFTGNFECLFMHDTLNTRCYFSLNKTRIGAEDTDTDSQLIEKANAYLADNPITAYYKLGKPIETDISDTIDWDKLLHLSRHTNILSSSTTISPSNLYIKYIRK